MARWRWWPEPEGRYMQAIQVLKSEKPLQLPAIKPLMAVRHRPLKPLGRVVKMERGQ